MSIKTIDEQYIAHTYKRFDLAIIKGEGCLCRDENGKEYIDMTSGIGVNAFGYSDPVWAQAVADQAKTLQHTSNLYYTAPCAELAEILCTCTGMSKVFFSNSGAEANECAVKVARKYAASHKGAEYFNIITLNKSFHGRTLTTLAATGQDHFHRDFLPLTEGFLYAEPNDIDGLKQLVAENKIAGILIETVQGEGGVNTLDADFVKAVENICKENDIVFMIDEVQTGNGRTGKLYSYMHFGVQPDVVSTAKGLAAGLPMGATLMSEKVADVLSYGDHGSTFGGNPVCAAAAISVMNRMDDAFLAEVAQKGNYVKTRLEEAGFEVSGLGLMIGIKTEKPVAEVLSACIEKGVLCLSAKDKLRLLPPLNIPAEQLQKAVDVIIDCLQ
ncbi:MAG: aspartate aminotransferase family protein [Ruminococcus sp.]|uniref:aspartate aminotransferase family protein n=1 Tax=Ruminococcus sp. TaxID=41978 RepID=UPI002873242A|nr:aspartate aminotransferase family protein [Ruminococcus sp.]MBQ3284604.1 aspartate aminotransferase family protein [Ruminococcus sp.]MBQ9515196.1 aspartate aminotransferase family protein [Ruminococcus sp.]